MVEKATPQGVIAYTRYLKTIYPELEKVYLFGSFLKGTAHPDSDIDIAAVFRNVTDSFDLQVELMKIRRKYDTRIEPHVFESEDFKKPNPLVEEILKKGIEIQE